MVNEYHQGTSTLDVTEQNGHTFTATFTFSTPGGEDSEVVVGAFTPDGTLMYAASEEGVISFDVIDADTLDYCYVAPGDDLRTSCARLEKTGRAGREPTDRTERQRTSTASRAGPASPAAELAVGCPHAATASCSRRRQRSRRRWAAPAPASAAATRAGAVEWPDRSGQPSARVRALRRAARRGRMGGALFGAGGEEARTQRMSAGVGWEHGLGMTFGWWAVLGAPPDATV